MSLVAGFAFCGLPVPSQAQGKVYGLQKWPMVGAWGVSMVPNVFNTDEECWISSYGPPFGPNGYSLIFYVGRENATVGLDYSGPKFLQSRNLSLTVDGGQRVELLVTTQIGAQDNDNNNQIVANLSRDTLEKTILPAMIDQKTITAELGSHSYTLPIQNFRAIVQEYYLCSNTAWSRRAPD
jgi:hypothetical protein